MKRSAIKDLSCECVDYKPVNIDWGDHPYGETWETIEALTCKKCGVVVSGKGGEQHRYLDTDSECDGLVPSSEGPIMNCYYPIPDDWVDERARMIAHLPLCIVEGDAVNGQALALTGGGMDLGWEICEAYMLFGFLPPLHFAGLPDIVGRGTSKRDRWIIAGCLKSCAVAASRAKGRARRLRETAKAARERAKGRAA